MDTPKLFVTGATGYIGGDFLAEVVNSHPDWEIHCLVRDHEKGSKLVAAFPQIRIIHGTLDSAAEIEEVVAEVNVVLHFASSDNVSSAKAIARGLAKNKFSRVYWIHTSGSGILTHRNFSSKAFGHLLPGDEKVYDDWENNSELTSLPDYAIHRHVDKIVLAASLPDKSKIRTAIVAPSCIYGVGRGPGNARSVQVYEATSAALARGKAVMVGTGTNRWNAVHIRDLSKLYLLLAEAAVSTASPASWNEEGYYLAENGEFAWGEIIKAVALYGYNNGLLRSSDVDSVTAEESRQFHKWYPELTGTTSRCVAKRARELLGWKPVERSLEDELPSIIDNEAKLLGLAPEQGKSSNL